MTKIVAASDEPDFKEVNGVEIVKPTVRIPLGQYILISPESGVMFPSVPFGPRGEVMAEKLDKIIVEVAKIISAKEKLGNTETGNLDELGFTAIMQDVAMPAHEFYEAGLRINYDEKVTAWILENMPIAMGLIGKLISAAQGDIVDAETFRVQPRQV